MTIFEQASLSIQQSLFVNTNDNFRSRINPIIISITQELSNIDISLSTIQNNIPGIRDGHTPANEHPQYETINDYLLGFNNEMLEIEQILNNPQITDSELESIYQDFVKFDRVITMINSMKDETIADIITQYEAIISDQSASSGSTQPASVQSASIGSTSETPSPTESQPNLFNFESRMKLEDFLKNFDQGISNFNNKVKDYKENKKIFNREHKQIDKNIHLKQEETTITRGGKHLADKLEFYNKWIKFMYWLHRITLFMLCIIVIISLTYKLLNKS